MISMKDACPEDITQTLMGHAKDVWWQKMGKNEELKECGSNQSRAC